MKTACAPEGRVVAGGGAQSGRDPGLDQSEQCRDSDGPEGPIKRRSKSKSKSKSVDQKSSKEGREHLGSRRDSPPRVVVPSNFIFWGGVWEIAVEATP